MFAKNEKNDLIFYHAVVIFVLLWLFIVRFQYVFIQSFWSDEALYSWLANRIYENPSAIFSKESFSPLHPPLFISLLAGFRHLFPSLAPEVAYRFFSYLVYMIGVVVIYMMGTKFKSREVGLFCALILAFNENYFVCSMHILIDMLLMVIFAFFLYGY